jgi:hypothetical protein
VRAAAERLGIDAELGLETLAREDLVHRGFSESAVVVAGAIRDQGDACCGCCPVLNFFASTANADRWLGEDPEVRGTVISMREASDAGHAVFGDVLAPS